MHKAFNKRNKEVLRMKRMIVVGVMLLFVCIMSGCGKKNNIKSEPTQNINSDTEYSTLGNQSEQYNYANGIEIVKIGGKIARSRIAKHDENYAPKYIPGNFVPSKNVGDEQDSDKIDYIITPPTGTQETLVYIIITVVGLIIVSAGVVLIKKFVIKK